MKKFTLGLVLVVLLFSGAKNIGYAAGDVSLTVKNDGAIIYSGNIALPPAGTVEINDSGGTPHSLNADSVLSVLNSADALSADFNISNLIYYSSFGAFYLKCITVSGATELCDNWQYKVNGDSPMVGMDSEVLSGGENVVVYFGSDSAPTDEAFGSGPLVTNPPPAPDWLVPKETPPPQETLNVSVPPPSSNNPPVSPSLQISPSPAIKDAGVEENKTKIKPELKITLKTKNTVRKEINKMASQNTATVINAVSPSPTPIKTETPKKSWFRKLLDNIFGFF